jgi:hypothetical protein
LHCDRHFKSPWFGMVTSGKSLGQLSWVVVLGRCLGGSVA